VSRSGYVDDGDLAATNLWRGAVRSALRGRRGQAFLREMLAALDAMPEKRLVTSDLETSAGDVCALGALGRARAMNMSGLDPEDHENVAAAFGVAHALACEIMYENDEFWQPESPENRWWRMRRWVMENIR
jgi:hypothetical protein